MATLIVHFQVVAETARVFGNLSRRSDIRMVKAQKILSFMADIVLQRNAPYLNSLKRLCIKLRLTEIKFVYCMVGLGFETFIRVNEEDNT